MTPAIATGNPPILCEAMYFEHQKTAGYLIVSVLLVIAGIGFIIAILWYFVKKDVAGTGLIVATVVAVPVAIAEIFSIWLAE
jgi:hypothetical protein